MESNPYAPPAQTEPTIRRLRPLAWLFSTTCWAAAVFMVYGTFVILVDPAQAAKRSEWYLPYLVFAVVITLVLPAAGLVLIGLGALIRARSVFFLGAFGFVPIAVVILYRLWQMYWASQ